MLPLIFLSITIRFKIRNYLGMVEERTLRFKCEKQGKDKVIFFKTILSKYIILRKFIALTDYLLIIIRLYDKEILYEREDIALNFKYSHVAQKCIYKLRSVIAIAM